MKIFWKRIISTYICLLLFLAASAGALYLLLPRMQYGFSRDVSDAERTIRMQLVTTAEGWLGTVEGDEQHKRIY